MKKIITLSLLCLFGLSLFGQPPGDRRERMEDRVRSMRIAFITDKLALTPEESQQFWPVYNEFTTSLESLRDAEEESGPFEEMSDKEATAFLDQSISTKRQELALMEDYIIRLKKVIPVQKVAKLHIIEREFKKEMLSQMRKKSGEKRGKINRNN